MMNEVFEVLFEVLFEVNMTTDLNNFFFNE